MQAVKTCFAGLFAGWRRKENIVRQEHGSVLLGRVNQEAEKPQPKVEVARSGADQSRKRKLIFLDMDGPMAPWRNGREHKWSLDDTFEDRAYSRNVDALLRIINAAGGPEVVKVIISSNWRTDPDKYPWLLYHMGKRGVDVIGHTDVMRTHYRPANHTNFERILEIRRVLDKHIVGTKGPYVTKDGTNAFEAALLPEDWKITSWIAIDDLDLGTSRYDGMQNIHYLSRFMPVPSDADVGKGWMSPPVNFVDSTRSWLKTFASSHFVRVDATGGIASTSGAEARAIKLLSNA